MSNYTQTTFFAPKDALLSGDPNKIIRGSQLDPEFAAIAVSLATKYDVSNISGAPVGFNSGAANAPGITFAADTDTGLYRAGANEIGVAVGGLQAVDIAASQLAAVGAAGVAASLVVAGNGVAIANGLTMRQSAAGLAQFLLNGGEICNIDSNGHWAFDAPTVGGASGFTFNGRNGNNLALFAQAAGAGTAFGVQFKAGTTSADYSALFQTQGGADILRVRGDGSILGQGPVAGANVDMTPDASSFTGTYATGFSTTPTGTFFWSRNGNQVTLFFPALTATSTTTAWTITGLPAAIQPTRAQSALVGAAGEDNTAIGGFTLTAVFAAGSGTITMGKNGSAGGFTASGTKGVATPGVCTYLLN